MKRAVSEHEIAFLHNLQDKISKTNNWNYFLFILTFIQAIILILYFPKENVNKNEW